MYQMKWLLGSILFLCMLPSQAQVLNQRPKEGGQEYVLGVGDQVSVHVASMEDMPAGPMQIGPNGALDFPLIGQVQAGGLTIDGFRESLSAKLSKYITSPDITVNLVETQSRPVSVVGEVSNPGLHQMVGVKRLLDVISMSGGLKADAGPNVVITRQSQQGKLGVGPVTVDSASGASSTILPLDTLLALKSPGDNIIMEPGDVISVPKAELIYVVGDVHKAGGFEVRTHNTVSLMQAVSMAEGLAPDNAAGRARIIRPAPNGDGTMSEIPVDINKIFAGKEPDQKLYANDILFVPHSGFKVGSRRAIEAAISLSTGALIYR